MPNTTPSFPAVVAYAKMLPEPCPRAVVNYYRADGSVIERVDVELVPVPSPADVLSVLVGASQLR